MGGFIDTLKDFASMQPKDYTDPTWLQKTHSKWDQEISNTQRKVVLVVYPILTVLVIVGGAAACYYAPPHISKYIALGITIGVPGIYFGAYPLCKWVWGKSYSEQTLKMEEGKITDEKKKWFEQHGAKHMLDFDIAHLKGPEKGKEDQYLPDINELLSHCTKIRTASIGRNFDRTTLRHLSLSDRIKKLDIDFSEGPGYRRTDAARLALARELPRTLKHLNLSMPDKVEYVAGEAPFTQVRMTAAMIEAIVERCPNLKTIQLTHLNHDSWPKFGTAKNLREITVEVKSLTEMNAVQATGLNDLRDSLRATKEREKCKPFKEIKILHPKLDQNNRHDDDFKEDVRDILEGDNGKFGIDTEGAKDEKEYAVLRFRTTPNEWRAHRQRIWNSVTGIFG